MTKVAPAPKDEARMDPRVAARRTSLARAHTARRLRLLAIVGAAVLALALVGAVWFTPLFDVDRIVVRGHRAVPADTIREASGIDQGDPLLLVRPGSAARRVERVPYVASARVKRIFPGTVIITVRERVATAVAPLDEQRVAVLDASGRVLAVEESLPPGLTRIEGFTRVPAPGKYAAPSELSRVLQELPPGLRSLIATVVWDGNEVTLRLVDELEVRLGDMSNIRAKGAVAEAVIDRNRPGTRVVDVRVPTVPVSK